LKAKPNQRACSEPTHAPTIHPPTITTTTHHRVLYLAVSPDGQTIVTGAGDETLRFWNVFPGSKGGAGGGGGGESSVSSLMRTMIR